MVDIPVRSRNFTWQDPRITAQANRTLSGLELFQAMAEGKLPPPPIAALMGFSVSEVAKGRVVFEVDPAEYHYNPGGVVHGGLAATLCDSAASCAIHSTLPAGVYSTTINLNVTFLRPVLVENGRLRCIGEVIYTGRRTATATARLEDSNGKLYAQATVTCMVIEV